MKKILITGCSGYIGSHLCKLLENQYEVHGLDIKPPQHRIANFIQEDINRKFVIDEKYHAVIHLAALVNIAEGEQFPIQYYITNLNGTMNVVNKISTDNFIFASTGAAESCKNTYGISKKAAEEVVESFFSIHRPESSYTIFRFYNVIGTSGFAPTNSDGLMHNLMRSYASRQFTIFGNDYETHDGTCVRDYVHVDEICNALQMAIEKPANKIESLGHGIGHSVKEIAELFKKVNRCDFNITYEPRRKGDIASSVLQEVSPYMKSLYSLEEILRLF